VAGLEGATAVRGPEEEMAVSGWGAAGPEVRGSAAAGLAAADWEEAGSG